MSLFFEAPTSSENLLFCKFNSQVHIWALGYISCARTKRTVCTNADDPTQELEYHQVISPMAERWMYRGVSGRGVRGMKGGSWRDWWSDGLFKSHSISSRNVPAPLAIQGNEESGFNTWWKDKKIFGHCYLRSRYFIGCFFFLLGTSCQNYLYYTHLTCSLFEVTLPYIFL